MAENDEERSSEDLTEEVSSFRLEEYRRKGQVSQSRELSGLLALLAAGVATYALAPSMGTQISEFMREVFRTDLSSRADLMGTHVLADTLIRALKIMAAVGLPVCLAGFILGAAGSFVQIGSIFSTDPLTPSFDKINPLSGIKRLFSKQHALDGVRIIFKTITVVAVIYALVKTEIFNSPGYLDQEQSSLFALFGRAAKMMFLSLIGVLGIFAVFDFGLQRWEYRKKLRMTKQEAKQEYKEREGDPQIKARVRAIQREVSRKRMMQAVRTADVVVTNPTHIAVAIVYDKDKMAAPKVVAKGADFVAQKIKKIASDAGVPLVENVPLARTLFKSVKIGQYIPRVLYQAVAEVLAYVYRLKGKGV